ncbi:MAG TPA: proton-conducting transporter membrane subunit [Candidatus Sulfomarinibacteraceae bacterium]|nr:proton-conducting transporter membrane subunit [Candidatus Sulfomarinibacteraceae bacterium]
MSVVVLGVAAVTGGLLALLARSRPWLATATGLVAAILAVALARLVGSQDSILLAGTVLAGSDAIRTIALAWAAGIALVGVADALVGSGRGVPGSALVGLGAGVVALSSADAGLGFALLTAGSIVAAIGPLALGPEASGEIEISGPRTLRPIVAAGLLALLAVAWGASAVGPFAAVVPEGPTDPTVEIAIGLGFLAVVGAVIIRLGALPAHVWAARFVESANAGAIPSTLGWGAAGFGLVALAWVEVTIAPVGAPLTTERTMIAVVAIASILLGAIAAFLHDDLEHILGYSIVQDAGVALLAFSAGGPEAATAGRDWLVAMAAVKSGLAAWLLVTRSTFGVRRLSVLHGWARSSPVLGIAFVVVLIGAVGLPGMAAFEARGALIERAVGAPLGTVVLLAAFAPLIYLGRVLAAGVGRTSDAVLAAGDLGPALRRFQPEGWTVTSAVTVVRAVPGLVRANRFTLAAASALAVALIGLAVATGGVGPAGSG